MKYTVLASGSKGNACLIETEEAKILIDCGTTKKYLVTSLESIDVQIEDIDTLLITHDHSDHTRQINTFKNHHVLTPTKLSIPHEQIEAYQPFELHGFTIMPIQTSHDAELSFGYVIHYKEKKLVYITDTGYIRRSDYEHIRNADYYVLESNHDSDMLMKTRRPYAIKRRILSETGHLSNDQAGSILSEVVGEKTKEVILAHLSEEANTDQLAQRTVKSYLVNSDINVYVAKQHEILIGGTYYEK
ncbi:MBL fold metallo-hydrolase [Erysipelothrix urinaevulpis]|uniref:MBL fold metallo-hydrolase n=1 Tax=Erysipelothrix urinaevulpis TaxID=2683717 RepID=UPI0013579B1D|nr:MBL fold metallo-hydrolase [Erysipelothrix urinaevulpis]